MFLSGNGDVDVAFAFPRSDPIELYGLSISCLGSTDGDQSHAKVQSRFDAVPILLKFFIPIKPHVNQT